MLEPQRVNGLEDIVELAAGTYHTCAADASGDAWCWGTNSFGQIGHGGWEAQVRTPTKVKDLSGVSRLSLGTSHACALLDNTQVWCWGSGMFGSLGDGAGFPQDSAVPLRAKDLENVVDISLAGDGSCAVTEDGTVWCWGTAVEGDGLPGPGGPLSEPGTVGLLKLPGPGGGASAPEKVDGIEGAAKVGIGKSHNCAIDKEKGLLCWGDNSEGQLGDGTKTKRSSPTAVDW